MSITLDLPQELEEELSAEAARLNLPLSFNRKKTPTIATSGKQLRQCFAHLSCRARRLVGDAGCSTWGNPKTAPAHELRTESLRVLTISVLLLRLKFAIIYIPHS